MLILKQLKVLCFDTLLQVLILKVVMGALKLRNSEGPPHGFFAEGPFLLGYQYSGLWAGHDHHPRTRQ